MWSFVLACVLPGLAVGSWYRPHLNDRFQIQLSLHHHFDYSMQADLYDTDMWALTHTQIHDIHATESRKITIERLDAADFKGGHVVCYFSAGTYDPNRPDHTSFHSSSDFGNKMADWDEYYLNIKGLGYRLYQHYIRPLTRSSNVKHIMAKRMDYAKDKGCDAIDPDNVDGWQAHNSGFSFTKADQVAYNSWLADQAHSRGLGIGLKNSGYLVDQLHSKFDFVIDESCHNWGDQCYMYQPFLDAGKPVYNLEYVSGHHPSSSDLHKCTSKHPSGLQTQFKLRALDAWAQHCHGQ